MLALKFLLMLAITCGIIYGFVLLLTSLIIRIRAYLDEDRRRAEELLSKADEAAEKLRNTITETRQSRQN